MRRVLLTPALVVALVVVFALPPAAALSCPGPPSEWAEFEIHDEAGRLLARIPYEHHRPGYGCNVGNEHALRGQWFAWVADDAPASSGGVAPGTVHVVDLGTGGATSFPSGTGRGIHQMDLAEGPMVLLLTHDGDWVVERRGPAGALPAVRLAGHQALLHGGVALVLERADRPAVAWHDLVEDRPLGRVEVPAPPEAEPPWRIMEGDASRVVLASSAGQGAGAFLPAEAHVWVYDAGAGEVHGLPPPADTEGRHPEESRYGSFALDGDRIYHEVWTSTLPWFPTELQVRAFPDGRPEATGVGGLMRGVVVDAGRVVTGGHLEGRPADARPWVGEGAAPPPQPTPTEGAAAVPVLALLLAAAALLRFEARPVAPASGPRRGRPRRARRALRRRRVA